MWLSDSDPFRGWGLVQLFRKPCCDVVPRRRALPDAQAGELCRLPALPPGFVPLSVLIKATFSAWSQSQSP